jgi:hypothetical protein
MSDSRQQSARDPRDVIVESAWPKWAALVESRHCKGHDLKLSDVIALFPSPSPKRDALWEKHRRTTRHMPAIRSCVSLRQLRRLAASNRIPGCYRLKGGHYRIRRCVAFYRWLATGGVAPRPSLSYRMKVEDDRNMIRVIALKTSSGLNGAFGQDPHELWKTPVAKFPPEYRGASAKADQLEIAVALGELRLSREEITALNVARKLGISRATLYRRGFRRLREALDNDMAVPRDSRAKKVWASKLVD